MSRVKRLALGIGALGLTAGALLWVLSAPGQTAPEREAELTSLEGSAEAGARIFHAGGCASCHAAPGAEGEAKLRLVGGRKLPSPFGTFVAPNVSMHPEDGIGGWTLAQFDAALRRGVSPEGAHYYPAFPYTSYARMRTQDVADLWAFWQGLPAVEGRAGAHDLPFPFTIRRGLGLWKRLYLRPGWAVEGEMTDAEAQGRYLAEALGHCGECHTPRDAFGGLNRAAWLAGAPDPSGKGRVPDITPGALDWSTADIEAYLATGLTPDYDSAGGHMALVIEGTAELTKEDRAALAAYLKRVPPSDGGAPEGGVQGTGG